MSQRTWASSTSIGRSRNWRCWVRDRIVSLTFWGSVVASTNTTWGGGSSSVFKQRRLGRLGEHVDLVEDVHLVAPRRAEHRLFDEVAHRLDTVVARRVEFVDVVARAVLDGEARGALAARLAVDLVLAVEDLGQDPGRGGLAGAAGPREEVGLALAMVDHGVAQGPYHVFLSLQLAESAGAIAPVEGLGGHRGEPTQGVSPSRPSPIRAPGRNYRDQGMCARQTKPPRLMVVDRRTARARDAPRRPRSTPRRSGAAVDAAGAAAAGAIGLDDQTSPSDGQTMPTSPDQLAWCSPPRSPSRRASSSRTASTQPVAALGPVARGDDAQIWYVPITTPARRRHLPGHLDRRRRRAARTRFTIGTRAATATTQPGSGGSATTAVGSGSARSAATPSPTTGRPQPRDGQGVQRHRPLDFVPRRSASLRGRAAADRGRLGRGRRVRPHRPVPPHRLGGGARRHRAEHRLQPGGA